MPLHVRMWARTGPKERRRAVFAFNLDDATLRARFIEPYERGDPITWTGRTLIPEDIDYIQVHTTPGDLNPDWLARNVQEYEAFMSGSDVTNEWITGGPGSRTQAGETSALSTVTRLCIRFDTVARQLGRPRHATREPLTIVDEFDVQYLMHALLLVEFDDVRAESWNPNYLGGASRVDFLLPEQGIVIEVKKTREGLGDRAIGNQLAEDVTLYSDPAANRGAAVLVCFVYDPGRIIANRRGLERDLASASNERLRVVGIVG